MSGWEPGDLALCIKTGPWIGRVTGRVGPGPKAGQVLLVAAAGIIRGTGCLGFTKYQLKNGKLRGFHEYRFTKITPGTDVQAFEEPRRVPVKERVDA